MVVLGLVLLELRNALHKFYFTALKGYMSGHYHILLDTSRISSGALLVCSWEHLIRNSKWATSRQHFCAIGGWLGGTKNGKPLQWHHFGELNAAKINDTRRKMFTSAIYGQWNPISR